LSKETTTARRNKLEVDLVEALQILKYGRKHSKGISFTEGLEEREEQKEMEEYEGIQPTDDFLKVYTKRS
jgi:hypothetical protein